MLRRLLLVLLLSLAWCAVAWRLMQLQTPLMTETPSSIEVEDAILFKHALAANLLIPEADGRLLPAPRDKLLEQRWRGEPENPEQTRWLQALYHSSAGNAVRGQLKLWNRTRRLAAVRDNSASRGVSREGWYAYDCQGRLKALGGVVPEGFGFVHQGRLRVGFEPWVVSSGGDCVEFRARLRATQPQAVTVWFIGQSIELAAATSFSPPRRRVAQPCLQQSAKAGAWEIPTTGWQQDSEGWIRTVSLRLQPTVYSGLRVAGVKVYQQDDCRYAWHDGQNSRSTPSPRHYHLISADGVALLDAQGQPTQQAKDLNLLPLVGFGKADYDSIGGLLNRSMLPSGGYSVRLSIDSRIQQVAQTALSRKLIELYSTKDPYSLERRAALIVMNADSGAIVAAAGLPAVPDLAQLSHWDLAAFAKVYPDRDPLRVRAWQEALDRHNAPGSTFKPVTALAALTAVAEQGDARLMGMLAGWSKERFTQQTGLRVDATSYDPYADVPSGSPDGRSRLLRNFRDNAGRRQRLGDLLKPALRDPGCISRSPRNTTIGLPPAIRDSLNIWFARLALLVDATAADTYDNDKRPLASRPVPDTYLAKTLRQLGFAESLDLLSGAPAFIHRHTRPTLPADSVTLLGPRPTPMRWVIAQNAIGQGSAVTPLRLAVLAATLARGRLVQPYLVTNWGEHNVEPRTDQTLGVDLKLLNVGMKAVPEVGTAKTAFKGNPNRCVVYGKTGTAEVAKTTGRALEPYNTAWFIGWREPEAGQTRLAFACMVTHAHGRDRNSGGRVCAPLVAEMLRALFPKDS